MRKCLMMLTTLFLSIVVFAQQKQLSGTVVKKSTSEALQGVSVQGKNINTVTDAAGKYSVMAAVGDVITFSYTGLKQVQLTITGSTISGDIQMEEDLQDLNAVIVTGYTTEKKRDLKGAVSVVKMTDVLKETNANIVTSLQGRVPGLEISTDGAPGSGVFINLRGLASFNNNTPPLFIIDGVPTYDFNGISPNDIESLQVLKDAASAAIYGARASSGVIVITTKRGKSKNAVITFDAFYGTKTRRNTLDMLNAQQYGQVIWQGFKNDNNGATPNDPVYGNGPEPVIPDFIDAGKTTPSGNTNWQKEVFQPAANMAYNFGVTKAADKSNFYFGANYNREDGLAQQTFYDRLTLRMNSSFKVGNRVTVGENLSVGYLRGNRENEARVLEAAVVQQAIIPLKDNLGNWAGPFSSLGDYHNPVGDLNLFKGNVSKGWRTFGNVFMDVEIIKGLIYHGSMAMDMISSEYKAFTPKYVMGSFSNLENSLSQTDNHTINLTATHTLTYNWSKGKHDVQLLAGYEWIHNEFHFLTASAKNFFVESPDFIYLSAGTPTTSGGSGSEYGLIGKFGKIDYKYNDRYLFSASLRRDGSSRFGEANRYGNFAAFSAAWRVSEENFFTKSSISKTISDLKIRGSWGQNGNDNIKDYNYATFYAPSINYANYDVTGSNTGAATGYIVSSLGNPLTKWEAVAQTNIGIDLGLFNNRLYVSADYYVKQSTDLLYQAPIAGTVGEGTPPFINVGDIKNQGLEMLISYKGANKGKLNYSFDLSFTSNKNKVISVGKDGKDILYPGFGILQQGQPIGEFYGYQVAGIFQTQDEVDAATQDGKHLGGLKYVDVNGDKVITPADRTYLGSPLPKVLLGLNTNLSYGNFDANIFIDSKLGNKIWDQTKVATDFLGYASNHGTVLLNAWSPTNTGSTIPILSNNFAQFDKQNSSYFVSNGSYARLKSATIGYTLPKSFLNKLKITKFRLFVQAENIFTITGFKGYDYETLNASIGSTGVSTLSSYPHSKAITFGLNAGF